MKKKNTPEVSAGIFIGNTSNSSETFTQMFQDVLKSTNSESVKIEAFKTLQKIGTISEITVANCMIEQTQ